MPPKTPNFLNYEATELANGAQVDFHLGDERLLPTEIAQQNEQRARLEIEAHLRELENNPTPSSQLARVGLLLARYRQEEFELAGQ